MTTEYAPPVTPDTDAALLQQIPGVVVEYTHIDPVQCEHCAEVDALVEARIYGPRDAEPGLYAECCLRCAYGVATYHTEQGAGDVLVELHTPKER